MIRNAPVFVAASLFACTAASPPQAQPTAVKVSLVDRAGSAAGARYSAQIEPATRVDLAFKVGGYVDNISKLPGVDGKLRILQEGDAVKAGEELASLRKTDYAQKRGEAQAALAEAKAAAEQAQLDFDRSTKLAASGTVPTAQLDAARIHSDSARAQLAGAQVRLAESQTAFDDTSLRSPIDGVVVKRAIEVGALAAPGTVGFSVAETRNVKAVFGVPDTILPGIQLGARQAISTQAYKDVQFDGRITRVSPTADLKSRTFEIEVTVPNADQRLKSGMVASLALETQQSPSAGEPLIPLSAIVRSPTHPGQFAVFVVADSSGATVARARDVELGEYLGRVIPVVHGLSGGERVVVQGAGLLSDGETVEVIP